MAQAPLNIHGYAIEDLVLRPMTWDDEKPVVAQINFEFTFAVEDEHSFRVRLKTRFSTEGLVLPPNLPYALEVTAVGAFETPLLLQNEMIPSPLALNSLIVMYGTLRGFVAQTTSVMINGALIIPGVTFDTMVDRAARTAGTAVYPVDAAFREPGASEMFGFIYAVEDLPRIIDVLSNPVLQDALRVYATELQNRARSGTDDGRAKDMLRQLTEIESRLDTASQSEKALMAPLIARIRVGLERLEAIATAQDGAGAE